jgi:electron transfer flavoprotein alpha subunit
MDVIDILPDGRTFKRPVYAGNAIATVRVAGEVPATAAASSPAPPIALTVRPTAFPPASVPSSSISNDKIPIEVLDTAALLAGREAAEVEGARVVGRARGRAEGRPQLGSAKVVVAGGRGLKR